MPPLAARIGALAGAGMAPIAVTKAAPIAVPTSPVAPSVVAKAVSRAAITEGARDPRPQTGSPTGKMACSESMAPKAPETGRSTS